MEKEYKERKFKVKTKDTFTDKILYCLIRIFKRKPKFINLNDHELPKQCIMIGNHNGAGGPFTFRVFLKHRFMSWGAHQMCENYRSRREYLYNIFYRQKLGYSKFKAYILSRLFGLIAGRCYRYAGIVPVYYDKRLKNTYRYSFDCIEKDVSVLVFPENSNSGYKQRLEEFFSGFLTLSNLYYKTRKTDLPIYTMFYNKKPKTIIIGKPMYLQELLKNHTEEEVLQIFLDYMNSLYDDYIAGKNKKEIINAAA